MFITFLSKKTFLSSHHLCQPWTSLCHRRWYVPRSSLHLVFCVSVFRFFSGNPISGMCRPSLSVILAIWPTQFYFSLLIVSKISWITDLSLTHLAKFQSFRVMFNIILSCACFIVLSFIFSWGSTFLHHRWQLAEYTGRQLFVWGRLVTFVLKDRACSARCMPSQRDSSLDLFFWGFLWNSL